MPILTGQITIADVDDGTDGAAGNNTALVYLYQKNQSETVAPADPSGTFTYTFTSRALTGGTLNGWTTTIPDLTNGDYLWVIAATANGTGATDTIPASEFGDAVVISSAGEHGNDGFSNALIQLFQAGTTTPADPTGTLTYNFSTDALTPASSFNGWSRSAPTLTEGQNLYSISAVAISQGSTDTIATDEWSAATIVGHFGEDGTDGAPGSTGPRTVTGQIWSQNTNANAPALPTNTNASWNFTNQTFTGNSFNASNGNWTRTPPATDASSANPYWSSSFTVTENDVDNAASNTSFGTAIKNTVFTGIVTFTNANQIGDGTDSLSFGNLASQNNVNLANQVGGTLPNANLNANVSLLGNTGSLFTNTTTISGGQINTGQIKGGNVDYNNTNDSWTGSGFYMTTVTDGDLSGGAWFVGNAANQYAAFDGTNFVFNGTVNFSNQVNGTGNLLTNVNLNNNIANVANNAIANNSTINTAVTNNNTTFNNTVTNNNTTINTAVLNNNNNYSVNATNQVNGLGNLATSNTTLGNLASSNSVLGTLATANVLNAANQLSGGIPNANLTNVNTAVFNTNNNNNTTIDGGNITTGTISADQIAAGAIAARQLAVVDHGARSAIGRWTELADTTPDTAGEIFFSTSITALTRPADGAAWNTIQRIVIYNDDDDGKQFDSIFGLMRAGSIIEVNQISNGLISNGAEFEVIGVSAYTVGTSTTITLTVTTEPDFDVGTFQQGEQYVVELTPNVVNVLRVGDIVTETTNAIPTSGAGAYISSEGKFTVGDTNEYMAWDGSTLTIQGAISNLTQARLDGLAGAWDLITEDVADLTNTQTFAEGAGLYRCIMVGGGGSGTSTVRWATATGGGAGGFAAWTLDWDGSTALAVDLGTGGAARTGNTTGAAGNASTFSVGGSVRITANGGSGGSFSNAAAVNGGAGGTAALTSSHSSISDTIFRTGGAGGNAGSMPSDGGVGTGGGGVDFLGNGDTRGGAVNRTGGNRVEGASGGGGPFGPGGDAVIGAGGNENTRRSASSGATSQSSALVSSFTNNATNTGSIGQNVLGPYLGSIPEGSSEYYASSSNSILTVELNPAMGICGGGGVVQSSTADSTLTAQSGYVFGGGGGCVTQDANSADTKAGDGGYGAGGGGVSGGSRESGAGGGGALFILKL